MNETAAIVGIYGAVDEAVRDGGPRREAVARLLPEYADPDFSWFGEVQTWLDSYGDEASREAPPGLEDGLALLAGVDPKCRMRARRLFAMAVATRAFPEMLNPETELGQLAIRAVAVDEISRMEEKARDLLYLLGEEGPLDESEIGGPDLARWWDGIIETSLKRRLLADATGLRPRPCSARLVRVPGAKGPAVAFVTEFLTSEVDFDHAIRFLNPVTWKECMPDFWCRMKELGPVGKGEVFRYEEVVSSDCKRRGTAWFNAETELDFTFWTLPSRSAPEVAISNYQLSNGRPREGDLILVDEGSLVVAKTGGGQAPLRINTTKRILFDHQFESRQLKMWMCALGYADVSGNLMCCAATKAATPKKGKAIGADFPGVSPPLKVSRAGRGSARGGGARGGSGRGSSAGVAPTARTSKRASAAGSTAADMVQNSVEVWARLLSGTAKAVERGAADVAPRTRPRRMDRTED